MTWHLNLSIINLFFFKWTKCITHLRASLMILLNFLNACRFAISFFFYGSLLDMVLHHYSFTDLLLCISLDYKLVLHYHFMQCFKIE